MHVYQEAYRKNLRRNAAIAVVLAACAVFAFCLKRYSDIVPLLGVPLGIFSIVHVIMLSEQVKARRRFEARGDAMANESRFDAEFRSEDALHFDHVHFTTNWLFCDRRSSTFLVPVSEVVWLYKLIENNKIPRLVIHFKHDDKVEMILEDKQIEAILHCVSLKYPHVVVGYSAELAAASENDKQAFRKGLAEAPRVFVDDSSPFVDPYYQTVVGVKTGGKKRNGLLALTRDQRLVLIRSGETLFDRAVTDIDSAASWWFGRLTLRFGHPDWGVHTVHTYNARRWLSLLRRARRGAPCGGCEKHSYSSVDAYAFTISQNKYYLRFVAAFVSLLFFGLIHFTYWVKEDSLWDDGVLMGIATYFLLPLALPPILLYGFFSLNGLWGARFFPNRKEEDCTNSK